MKRPILKSVRRGYSVDTAPERFLTIDSTRNQFKIVSRGQGSVALNSSNLWEASITINHNLGYKPFVLAWHTEKSNKWVKFPYYEGAGMFGPAGGIVSLIEHENNNTLRLIMYEQEDWSTFPPSNPPDVTIKYKYLIFVDPNRGAWYE